MTGQTAQREVVEDLAALVRGPDQRVTIDLAAAAKRLGAIDVLYRQQQVHGFTEWTARGPRVVLGVSPDDARRRATLAHECGHLAIDPLLEPADALGRRLPFEIPSPALRAAIRELHERVSLERLCDLLAFELVAPIRYVRDLANLPITLPMLQAFCDGLRTSMSLAVLQLNQVRVDEGNHRIGVLQMKSARQGYWLASSANGVPFSWRSRTSFDGHTNRLLDALLPGIVLHCTVGISNGQITRRVQADVLKHSKGATVLLDAEELYSGR